MRPVSRPRLKWHKLRRRKSDPPFLRENLDAALRAGAACEVDIVFTADGHAFCLHDLTLDAETTGAGAAAQTTRAQIESLRQRGTDGRVLATAPLFLDEIVETVRRIGTAAPALVQLDVKADAATVDSAAFGRLRRVLGNAAPSFIAGGCDFDLIARLGAAAPGLHLGFDPLDFYPRSCALTKEEFRRLGERTLAIAPGASMFYLEAKLVLAALDKGVNLVETVARNGALVDAWTLDADRPNLRHDLRCVIEAGCHQVTSNDPDVLCTLIEEITACS